LEDDTEVWEVDNHDELVAQQQRAELIEQYIQCHIGSYVVSEEYAGDPAGAYTACSEAASRHADLPTPSRNHESLKETVEETISTQVALIKAQAEKQYTNMQVMFNAQLNGSTQQMRALLPPPLLEGVTPPHGGTPFTPAPGHTQPPALKEGTQDVALATSPPGGTTTSNDLAPDQLAIKHTSVTFGTQQLMHLVEDGTNVGSPAASAQFSSESAQSMVPPPSAAMLGIGGAGALNIGGALTGGLPSKSPLHKKDKRVSNPLDVLRAALLHVPDPPGLIAVSGIPKDFSRTSQAFCDMVSGMIDKRHSPAEFEALLEEFGIFSERSQGMPTTTSCRVNHILYILARGMKTGSAQCGISYDDFVAVPALPHPVVKKLPGAVPCPRPGCKCTDKLNRRNTYCCPTCSRGAPCDMDQHYTPMICTSDNKEPSNRAFKRGASRATGNLLPGPKKKT
jgi:hypothetical protein